VVKNWKKVALDRNKWAKLLNQGPPRSVEPLMMMIMRCDGDLTYM